MKTKKIKIFSMFIILVLGVAGVFLLTQRTQAPAIKTKVTSGEVSTPTTIAPLQTFDITAHSTTEPSSIWVVVNKRRALNPLNYAPNDLVGVGGGQQLRSEAAESFAQLQADAKKVGLTISPLSGYRSYQTQVSVYNTEVKNNGQAKADTQSARAGTSEHQTGWAVDVGGGGCGIEDCFGATAEGKWLSIHAYEYGFIIRYTAEKQAVTGYRAEPWHIRYIGVSLSTEMHNKDISTLEEFFDLPAAPTYQ